MKLFLDYALAAAAISFAVIVFEVVPTLASLWRLVCDVVCDFRKRFG